MNDITIWMIIIAVSVIFGLLHYNAGYNSDLGKNNPYYKFLEFFRFCINYLISFVILYYFISVRWVNIYDGNNFSTGDFVLMVVFLIGIFGWLPYFVKNITEGITVLFKKILGN